MEVTPMGQTFYREEADKMFAGGCKCFDKSGDCDWCTIYYDGPTCWECGEIRLDDHRVLAGMKCSHCAYPGGA